MESENINSTSIFDVVYSILKIILDQALSITLTDDNKFLTEGATFSHYK